MAAKTVASIISEARVLADIAGGERFVTTEMSLAWLNDIRAELDLKLIRGSYILRPSRQTVVLDNSSYYEVDEPLALVSIHWVSVDGTKTYRVRPVHSATSYPIMAGRTSVSNSCPGSYYAEIVDGKLHIYFDVRVESGTIVVTTIPMPGNLVEGDSVNYPAGVTGWLTIELARRCAIRENSDIRLLEKMKVEKEEFIERLLAGRQVFDPPAIRTDDQAYLGSGIQNYEPMVAQQLIDWVFG